MDSQEIALYDRQIRLYGLSAQTKYTLINLSDMWNIFRIRSSRVGIIGCWTNCLQEILKNLALNGIGSIDLFLEDHSSSTHSIFGSPDSLSASLKDMNPGVHLNLASSADDLHLGSYDVLVLLAKDVSSLLHQSGKYRLLNNQKTAICFGDNSGLYYYADLIKHDYEYEKR